MKLQRNERGQMLIMTAIELALLLGFLALAADVGTLFHSRRQMQIAADAAATAGALNAYNAGIGATTQSNTTAAWNAAAANGYTNGQNGVTVTVNSPPTSGYHKTTGYVEVIISKPDPLYFFKVFSGQSTATVAARAVAGDPVASSGCIWTNQLFVKGSSSISGPNQTAACGIYVNSTASNAVYNQDKGTYINADFLDTPGGSAKFPTSPTPVATSATRPEPFQSVPMPTVGTGGPCSTANTYIYPTYPDSAGDQLHFQPYTFTSSTGQSTSINVVCFSANNVSIGSNSQSTTNMGNGFFFFVNGVTLNGTIQFGQLNPSSTTGSSAYGATVYNASGTLQYSNGEINVYAPTAGVYNGLAIVQPASNTNTLLVQFGMSGASQTQCGLSNAGIDGYIYAPGATVQMQDEGGGVAVTGIVSNYISNNSALIVCNYNSVNQATTPLKDIALVE